MSIENPRDVPEQWRPYFEKRDIEFTFNALDRQVHGVSLGTVIRTLTGEGNPTNRVAKAIGDALGISADKVRELRGEPVVEPFVLPTRARLLTNTEREVVRSVVNAILDARESAAAQSDAQSQTVEIKEGSGTPPEVDDVAMTAALSADIVEHPQDTGGLTGSPGTGGDSVEGSPDAAAGE